MAKHEALKGDILVSTHTQRVALSPEVSLELVLAEYRVEVVT